MNVNSAMDEGDVGTLEQTPSTSIMEIYEKYVDKYLGWELYEKMGEDLQCDREHALRLFIEKCWYDTNNEPKRYSKRAYMDLWNYTVSRQGWLRMKNSLIFQGFHDKSLWLDQSKLLKTTGTGLRHVVDPRHQKTWDKIIRLLTKQVDKGLPFEEAFRKVIHQHERPQISKQAFLDYIRIFAEFKKNIVKIESYRLSLGITGFAYGRQISEGKALWREARLVFTKAKLKLNSIRPKLTFTDRCKIVHRAYERCGLRAHFFKLAQDKKCLRGISSCFINCAIEYIRENLDKSWIPPYCLKDKVTKDSLVRLFVAGNNENWLKMERPKRPPNPVKSKEFIESLDSDSESDGDDDLTDDEESHDNDSDVFD